jgi:hypothetical protein
MRARPARAERTLALALVLSASAATAEAHLGHDVVRAERYLKVEVAPTGARFVVSLTLGPAEMATILEAADGDGDGTVTQAEADAYMGRWAEGLQTDLPVTIDGEAITLEWGEAYFDPLGAVRPVSGTVEMVAHHPLDGGEHTIALSDEMRLESLERTDVRLTVESPVELLAAGPGAERTADDDIIEDFYYGNDSRAAPDAVSLRVKVPGWSRFERWSFAGAAAFTVLLAILAWWRVRKRPRPPSG